MNPFTRVAKPATAAEHQAAANWATYERMAATEALSALPYGKAPAEVCAAAHTAKWVEKELARVARNAWGKERA
jgi:hypothetical protein